MIVTRNLVSAFLTTTMLVASAASYGQEHDENAEHGAHHEYLQNSIELFLGATHSDNDTNFSIGSIYEHRINETFGWGGIAEYTADEGNWLLVVPFSFIRPSRGA